MFFAVFFLYGFLFKKDRTIMCFVGYKITNLFSIVMTLSPNLRKQINTSSLGQNYDEEKVKFIENSFAHLTLALCILFSWFLHVGFKDLYFIVFLSSLIFFRPYSMMHKVFKNNVQMIDKRLPILLSQMILLIGAGMSTVNALEKVSEKQDDILTQQLYRVTQEVKLGGSFERRLMAFMAQCQQIYITRFGRILLSHQRNGTDASRRLLQELIEDLWKNRRSNALKKGEEASTKLLIPMSIALIGIFILITVPAIYEIFTLI